MSIRGTITAMLAAAAFLAASGAAQADEVADFYKGKTITIFVGYGAGGGYDTNARTLARHMGKHIPGNPDFIVKNMPGAGSLKAINYLYNQAPKDGTEIAAFASQVAIEQLVLGEGSGGIRFDAKKLTWLGSIDQFTPIGIAWHDSGVTSLEDVMKKELTIGTSGGNLSGAIYAKLLNGMIGTKFKSVSGYRGSKDITLAMEQKEVPAFVGWYWAGLKRSKPHWLEENKVNVFLYFNVNRHEELDKRGVPYIFDYLKKEEDRQVMRLVLSNLFFARPYAAPPEVPEARAKALQAAFTATMKDPEFQADLKKVGLNQNPVTGAQIQDLLDELFATPPELVEKVREAFPGS